MIKQQDWDAVKKRTDPSGKNLACPVCHEWKTLLLIDGEGRLTCWRCLRAAKKAKVQDVSMAV